MVHFVTLRLLSAITVMLGVASIVFMLIHVVPGDPVEVMLGESGTRADRAALRAALGLDRPLGEQWLRYVAAVAHGDLGTSLHSKRPIADLVAARAGSTVILGVAALAVSICIGLPIGVLAALHHGRWPDHGTLAISTLLVSIPSFWLGPLLILVFSIVFGWLPVSGREEAWALVLPALTLGLGMAAFLARIVRAAMLQVLAEDYLRTARAKGLAEVSVVLRHALCNAALPVLTVLGLQLGAVLAGAVIVETIFQWPGLGSLTVEAIQRRDYPVVQACVLLISLAYVAVNALTDIACGMLDPRVRLA
ncbi:MAG: ABC transporter permease [Chromatiales bacterium]